MRVSLLAVPCPAATALALRAACVAAAAHTQVRAAAPPPPPHSHTSISITLRSADRRKKEGSHSPEKKNADASAGTVARDGAREQRPAAKRRTGATASLQRSHCLRVRRHAVRLRQVSLQFHFIFWNVLSGRSEGTRRKSFNNTLSVEILNLEIEISRWFV